MNTKQPKNPFSLGNGYGMHVDVESRKEAVKQFDLDQCSAALAMPDLQKTVRQAVLRRVFQLTGNA